MITRKELEERLKKEQEKRFLEILASASFFKDDSLFRYKVLPSCIKINSTEYYLAWLILLGIPQKNRLKVEHVKELPDGRREAQIRFLFTPSEVLSLVFPYVQPPLSL